MIVTDTFDNSFGKGWNYTDGAWSIVSGQASINGYGKRTLGNIGWTDYTIDCDVTYKNGMNAGLIFRVNNPSQGGENNDSRLGTDFFQGYFVGMGSDKVTLGKHNYSWKSLATSPGSFSLNRKYHIRVAVKGANIKVYVDNMSVPKIDYTDPFPFISGKVGFRSHSTNVLFDNLVVTINDDFTMTGIETVERDSDCIIYPNPVKDMLTVKANDTIKSICVFSQTGVLIHAQQDSEPISMVDLPAGMYIVQVRKTSKTSNRKVIKE